MSYDDKFRVRRPAHLLRNIFREDELVRQTYAAVDDVQHVDALADEVRTRGAECIEHGLVGREIRCAHDDRRGHHDHQRARFNRHDIVLARA